MRAPVSLYLASSNPGKLAEFRRLAQRLPFVPVELAPLPDFDSLPSFEEAAPTFAENATGKVLHYSRFHDSLIFADDSGLVVPALGGAPGVRSARYAGPTASSAQRIAKLLSELRGNVDAERRAHFVSAIALAKSGRAFAVVTDRVDGEILDAARGNAGFGYDPVFFFPPLGKTFAELSLAQKNQHSHRAKAFLKLLRFLQDL